MSASLISKTQDKLIVQIEIPLSKSMLEGGSWIQDALNEAGTLATGELLKQFDTDGAPIELGAVKMTSKGLVTKQYQTPYGVAEIARHVYQTSTGGATFCPLDRDARIIVSSTPRFAKQISHRHVNVAKKYGAHEDFSEYTSEVLQGYFWTLTDLLQTANNVNQEAQKWLFTQHALL